MSNHRRSPVSRACVRRGAETDEEVITSYAVANKPHAYVSLRAYPQSQFPAGRFSHLFAKIAQHAAAPRGVTLLAMLVRPPPAACRTL